MFDYSAATCPYRFGQYFDEAGKSTNDPAADACSRRLHSGCRKRFSRNLPFLGFQAQQVRCDHLVRDTAAHQKQIIWSS